MSFAPESDELAFEGLLTGSSEARIRFFFAFMFRELGTPLPEEWPVLSPQERGLCLGQMREQLGPLYQYASSLAEWGPEQLAWLRLCGETVCQLLELEWDMPSAFVSDPGALDVVASWPSTESMWLPTAGSFQRLNDVILRSFGTADARVLWLGGCGVGCLAVAEEAECAYTVAGNSDVLRETFSRVEHVKYVSVQVGRGALPASFFQQFDAVVIAPEWQGKAFWKTLEQASFCLKDTLDARVYVLANTTLLEGKPSGMSKLLSFVPGLGLTFDQIEEAFWLLDWAKAGASEEADSRIHTVWKDAMPSLSSPLFSLLSQVPFATASLMTLRRLPFERGNALSRSWFYWRNRLGL